MQTAEKPYKHVRRDRLHHRAARLSAAVRRMVSVATVRFPRRGGQGVIVGDGLILTAAHVIGWTATGDMALASDDYRETVQIRSGEKVETSVVCLEPIADIAFLGCPDDQRSWDEAEAFESLIGAIRPLRIYEKELPIRRPMRVHILTHTGRWVEGTVQQYKPQSHRLHVHTFRPIAGGTSGGPIVTDRGDLVGVVSDAGGIIGAKEHDGLVPRVSRAAPVWMAERLREAGRHTKGKTR